MSQYATPTAEDIRSILKQFIDLDKLSYKLLSGGSQNTNYRIDTGSESYVLTICEEKSIEETEQLVHLLEHLADHNFPSSKAIRCRDGRATALWNDKPIMLKSYIHGQITNNIPTHLLELCGQRLAQLHRIPAPDYIPTDLCFGLNQFPEVALYAPDSEFHIWLKGITKLVNNHLSPDLPKALIHGDIFFSNVIISNDVTEATIMDFEEACYYYRIFDIGMMIVGLSSIGHSVDLKKAAVILRGYQSETTLSDLEKESLQAFTVYAAAATAFWRHRQFNYIHVDEDQKDRYMEMRDVAEGVLELGDKGFTNLFLG